MTTPRQEVLVAETPIRLRQRIETGRHVLVADEPRSSGGEDAGPDPYALLLAALGACTSMTLRLYADRKQWPLESITVRLSHERTHARDGVDCETKDDTRIDRITRVIGLGGPLTDEQKARLMEIADRCPVHRSLMGPKRIVSRLAEARVR